MKLAPFAIAAAILCAPRMSHACFLDGVTPMAFGNYDALSGSPLDTTASITLRCLVSLSVTIDISTGPNATYTQRTLKNAGNTLNYNVFRDAGRSVIWGDGVTSGTAHYGPVIAAVATIVLTVYGRIPARQNAVAGSYSDTLVVTLNY